MNDIAKRHPALVRAFERILYLGEQMAKLLRYSDGRGPKARDWHLNELSAVPERNSLNRCFYLHLTCLGCGELPCAVREIPESRFFPCASCQGEAEYRIMGEGGTLRALPFCERLVSDQYAAQILQGRKCGAKILLRPESLQVRLGSQASGAYGSSGKYGLASRFHILRDRVLHSEHPCAK